MVLYSHQSTVHFYLAFIDKARFLDAALAIGALLGQNMASAGSSALEFPLSSYAESGEDGFLSLHLWHDNSLI